MWVGTVGAAPPLFWLIYFFQKTAFYVLKAYISSCAFAINEDGVDKFIVLRFRHCNRTAETIKITKK